jgi:hypothetical protein
MNKALLSITIILGFVSVVLAAYLFLHKADVPVPVLIEETPEEQIYANSIYGISFEYSPDYFLTERDAGTAERPQLSLLIVEDTEENRDLIEGRTTDARDGPTGITVDVYPNPDRLTAEDWTRADTNWTVRTSEAAPIGRGQITGTTYSWSGLYEGKTVIVTEGTHSYVFSVTWLEPTDAILTEFDSILGSVELAP